MLNCTGGVCEVCPFGYTLSGDNCLQCANTKCSRCLATNNQTCTSCYDGTYLNGTTCVACPVGCETCSSGTHCTTCELGYTALSSPIVTSVSCVKCSSPCAQCSGTSSTCTSCISGFTLVGWKCLSSFNYGFTVTLNTNLATFYTNYQGFLQAIATSVQTSEINVTTLTSIATGSVIVNGNVTTLAQSDSN